MATAGLCRYDAYIATLGRFCGGAYVVEPCDAPATHRTIVLVGEPGLDVEVRSEVCALHERATSDMQDGVRSIKLRHPTTT